MFYEVEMNPTGRVSVMLSLEEKAVKRKQKRYIKKKNIMRDVYHSPQNAYEEFIMHPFAKNVVQGSAKVLTFISQQFREQDPLHPNLTVSQKYQYEVFSCLKDLIEGTERLYAIPFYMENNPNLKLFANRRIQPQNWSIYHYSNYLVAVMGIYDTVLLLVNSVLKLGFTPKECTHVKIMKNDMIKKLGIDRLLEHLNGIIVKYKDQRDHYVHRNKKPKIEFVDTLDKYDMVALGNEFKLFNQPIPKTSIAHAYFDQENRAKAKSMKVEIADIYKAVSLLFDCLNEIYLESSFQEN